MVAQFKEFLSGIIVENLHPELHNIITSNTHVNKQTLLAKKIRDLNNRGESTGIEGNMPKGSSRAYLKHREPHPIILDGKPAQIRTGIKVAIKSPLEKWHKKAPGDLSLGAMQNKAENGDYWVDRTYRILTHERDNHYYSNKESGIFPPLIDHHENHEYSHVGHARDVSRGEFKKLTRTESHPNGLDHNMFFDTLMREHQRNNGKYWESSPQKEAQMDHAQKHPLVQNFLDYHGNTGNSPADLHIKNMGVFEHPDGSKHIVARDHGYSLDVAKAYKKAHEEKGKSYRY